MSDVSSAFPQKIWEIPLPPPFRYQKPFPQNSLFFNIFFDVTKLSYHFNTFHEKVKDILLWNVLTL